MPVIAVEGLVKTYRNNNIKAVAGLSLSVEQGEIFGLLGPNGAGKSTTVRILATLTRPDSGTVHVAGCDALSAPHDVRRRIGYVAQASGVDKWATGHENLTLQAQLERVPPSRIAARVDEMLKWLDLEKAADRVVKTYSGGMKRRLDLGIGLVHEPQVLFLDEPTTGLDPETRSALWRDLRRLKETRKLTVLLTTHYLEEADQLCDRIAIIDQGKVVVTGTPAELKGRIQGDAAILELGSDAERGEELLKGLEGVLEVRRHENTLIVRTAQGARALPLYITALEGGGLPVRSATLSRPSLDDVYLHYTGHRFDAGEKTAPGDSE